MLSATEEKLLNMKTVSTIINLNDNDNVQGEERTVDIYLDPIVLRMETVASVKFVGKNITRNGVVSVESQVDVPANHRKVTYNNPVSPKTEKQKQKGGSPNADI